MEGWSRLDDRLEGASIWCDIQHGDIDPIGRGLGCEQREPDIAQGRSVVMKPLPSYGPVHRICGKDVSPVSTRSTMPESLEATCVVE